MMLCKILYNAMIIEKHKYNATLLELFLGIFHHPCMQHPILCLHNGMQDATEMS